MYSYKSDMQNVMRSQNDNIYDIQKRVRVRFQKTRNRNGNINVLKRP